MFIKSTMPVFPIVVFICILQWNGWASSQEIHDTRVSDTVIDRVNAWHLSPFRRVLVIGKLLSLDSKDADRVQIMNLYKFNKLGHKLSEISSKKLNKPPVFLIRDTTNRYDFVGHPIKISSWKTKDTLPMNAQTTPDFNLLKTSIIKILSSKVFGEASNEKIRNFYVDVEKKLYVATETKLDGVVPESSIVTFDCCPEAADVSIPEIVQK